MIASSTIELALIRILRRPAGAVVLDLVARSASIRPLAHESGATRSSAYFALRE